MSKFIGERKSLFGEALFGNSQNRRIKPTVNQDKKNLKNQSMSAKFNRKSGSIEIEDIPVVDKF